MITATLSNLVNLRIITKRLDMFVNKDKMASMIEVIKTPNILCIIDMQEFFPMSRKIIGEVCYQIRKAKYRKHPIILMEYANNGSTHHEVLEELKDYPYVYRRTKSIDDGSWEIKSIIDEHDLKGNVLICGVNRDACIRETILGLIGKVPHDIHFSKSATAGGACFTLEIISGVKKVD